MKEKKFETLLNDVYSDMDQSVLNEMISARQALTKLGNFAQRFSPDGKLIGGTEENRLELLAKSGKFQEAFKQFKDYEPQRVGAITNYAKNYGNLPNKINELIGNKKSHMYFNFPLIDFEKEFTGATQVAFINKSAEILHSATHLGIRKNTVFTRPVATNVYGGSYDQYGLLQIVNERMGAAGWDPNDFAVFLVPSASKTDQNASTPPAPESATPPAPESSPTTSPESAPTTAPESAPTTAPTTSPAPVTNLPPPPEYDDIIHQWDVHTYCEAVKAIIEPEKQNIEDLILYVYGGQQSNSNTGASQTSAAAPSGSTASGGKSQIDMGKLEAAMAAMRGGKAILFKNEAYTEAFVKKIEKAKNEYGISRDDVMASIEAVNRETDENKKLIGYYTIFGFPPDPHIDRGKDVLAKQFFSDFNRTMSRFYPTITNDIFYVPVPTWKELEKMSKMWMIGRGIQAFASNPVASIGRFLDLKNKALNVAKSRSRAMAGIYGL